MEHLYGGFKPPVVDFHDAEVDSGRSKDLSICVSEPGDGVRTFRLGSILDEGFHDKLPAPRSPLSSAPEARMLAGRTRLGRTTLRHPPYGHTVLRHTALRYCSAFDRDIQCHRVSERELELGVSGEGIEGARRKPEITQHFRIVGGRRMITAHGAEEAHKDQPGMWDTHLGSLVSTVDRIRKGSGPGVKKLSIMCPKY